MAGVSTSRPLVLGATLPVFTTFESSPPTNPTSHLFVRPTSHLQPILRTNQSYNQPANQQVGQSVRQSAVRQFAKLPYLWSFFLVPSLYVGFPSTLYQYESNRVRCQIYFYQSLTLYRSSFQKLFTLSVYCRRQHLTLTVHDQQFSVQSCQ